MPDHSKRTLEGNDPSDQTASDHDQTASDADQAASDADQTASDADQAASDAELAEHPSSSHARELHANHQMARLSSTFDRHTATVERSATAQERTDPIGWDVMRLGQLREALARKRLVLFAQPIVELSTDRIVQHELLVRMRGEQGELIAPGEFVPAAERFGMVTELDRWVLSEAVGFAARGHAIAVNVAGGTLADPDFGSYVERELVGADVAAPLVAFEVTETALIGNEGLALRFFDRVRALGCAVAFDDFGSGYGGFRYLKMFSVDYLKIDREFVSDLLTDSASEKVVHAVVQLADEFHLKTVAEGVEHRDQVERLRSMGVGYAQGYHFARPGPALEVLSNDLAPSPRAWA